MRYPVQGQGFRSKGIEFRARGNGYMVLGSGWEKIRGEGLRLKDQSRPRGIWLPDQHSDIMHSLVNAVFWISSKCGIFFLSHVGLV